MIVYLLLLVSLISGGKGDCPSYYLRFSQSHTYCKPPNGNCQITKKGVEPAQIQTILNQHNAYRNKVASGTESIGNLPSASNMMELQWDAELAAVAQKHAEQCEFEHDCGACRRVPNFSVGQNLYMQTVPDASWKADWKAAVKAWYDEVQYFKSLYIKKYVGSQGNHTYGHFSQVVWAESWKIGCGFTKYKDGANFKLLYTCNYGPAGNMLRSSMYKEGPACSACPENSCCGQSCSARGITANQPALCKMTAEEAPKYPEPKVAYIFNCAFHDEPDCKSTVDGKNAWKVFSTLSGNYLGIVLNGGESSTLAFNRAVKGKTSMCATILYRTAANVDGDAQSGIAVEKFVIPAANYKVDQPLSVQPNDFMKFGMSLGWNMETKISLSFSVPQGQPSQYFEMKSLKVKEGSC